MSTVFDITSLVLFSAAGFIHWQKWGEKGRTNWGPRLVAVLLLVGGISAAPLLYPLMQSVVDWFTRFLGQVVGATNAREWASVIQLVGNNAMWLVGTGLFILWLRALAPKTSATTSWALAWSGALVPALIMTAPPELHQIMLTAINAIAEFVRGVVVPLVSRGR